MSWSQFSVWKRCVEGEGAGQSLKERNRAVSIPYLCLFIIPFTYLTYSALLQTLDNLQSYSHLSSPSPNHSSSRHLGREFLLFTNPSPPSSSLLVHHLVRHSHSYASTTSPSHRASKRVTILMTDIDILHDVVVAFFACAKHQREMAVVGSAGELERMYRQRRG